MCTIKQLTLRYKTVKIPELQIIFTPFHTHVCEATKYTFNWTTADHSFVHSFAESIINYVKRFGNICWLEITGFWSINVCYTASAGGGGRRWWWRVGTTDGGKYRQHCFKVHEATKSDCSPKPSFKTAIGGRFVTDNASG